MHRSIIRASDNTALVLCSFTDKSSNGWVVRSTIIESDKEIGERLLAMEKFGTYEKMPTGGRPRHVRSDVLILARKVDDDHPHDQQNQHIPNPNEPKRDEPIQCDERLLNYVRALETENANLKALVQSQRASDPIGTHPPVASRVRFG
jgi:hypothetical protein